VTDSHAAAGAPPRAKQLGFDRYVLDMERGCLLLDGNEIALRPKTFAVLGFLIENFGRLVSKDELFDAVWPGLAVTDDALVQSVGELRRAFGEDGPRLIKTIPRRGYRFESDVVEVAPLAPPLPKPRSVSADADGSTRWIKHDTDRRRVLPLFQSRPASVRFGVCAALALGVIVTSGLLWTGIGTWMKSDVVAHADRTSSQNQENTPGPRIAVLPFLNQSDDPGREYFADGLTQDIISALGRFSKLTVMSWNSVLPYGGRPASPGQIARDLAVRYQVEGTVRQTGARVRVSAQLVDTQGRVLWSARYDEAMADVFALQDNITTQVVGALAIRVTQVEQRRTIAKPTGSLEAYDYVLRARPALLRPSRANNVEARRLLRQAILLDPDYAAAYAALAESYHIAVSMGWAESPAETLSRAEAMANKATSIDGSDVRAHIILGRVHMFYQRYVQAKVEMDLAIAINPNDADAIAGRGNALMWMGQTDAAIEALEAAQRIDPEMNAIDRFALSLAYYSKRRYDAAIEQAELNLRGTADANFSRNVLAAAYAQNNRVEDAARVVAIIRRMDPAFEPREFGSKFLNPVDLEHLRDGFRKAGLWSDPAVLPGP
jgi:adenylate cyclase